MPSFGQVRLDDVFEMLAECLPDFTYRERTHHICVWGGGRCYPALPKGAHKRAKREIQAGHVKKMARHFGILECAKRFLGL